MHPEPALDAPLEPPGISTRAYVPTRDHSRPPSDSDDDGPRHGSVTGGTIEMGRRHCMRCLLLSAAAWSLVFMGGEAFLTRTWVRLDAKSLRSIGPLSQRTAARAAAATPPVACSGIMEPLAVSPGNVDAPGQWSPMRDVGKGGEGGDDQEEDFNINLGRALDYLAADVPLMFSAPPRLEIFTSQIRLKVFRVGCVLLLLSEVGGLYVFI